MNTEKMWYDLIDQLETEINNCDELLQYDLSEEREIELNAFMVAYSNVLVYMQILEENENDERL